MESELKELKEAFEEYNRSIRLIFNKQLELLRSLRLSTMQQAGNHLENVKRLVETGALLRLAGKSKERNTK